ncbi:S1C family serine protease [Phaeacidiphilus oryzae]|uniref:S1C family serine protease n=1 Tax=Phaeacidiphilus oryzae TaxID=348818 RepID=UPI00055CE427|nr:trypsin-like peptidase domain-containing protein [Phaeacidiphilus oryzae]
MSTEQEGGGADVPSAKTPPEGEEVLHRLPPPQPPSAEPPAQPAAEPPAEHAAVPGAGPADASAPGPAAAPAGADAFAAAPPPPAEPPTQPYILGGQYPPPPAAPPKKGRGGLIALLAAVAVVAGGLGGVIGSSVEKSNSSSDSSTTVSSSTDPKALERSPNSVAGIAAKALPSVVTIEASGSQETGTGSGFVFDTQGHILTNNHVVAPALNGGKLTVKLSDGSSYPASVVGRASGYDVAVVKIDNPPTDKLKPLPLGDSDSVAVGDPTVAIGAPFGLSGTVTTGIVSAKNRPVASGDETGSQTSYMNALQTDASINPGNSGGPLLNGQGQVIGIDSAIQSTNSGGSSPFGGSSQQSGSIGLGFAIPINEARRVAGELINTGQPIYPIIGVLRNDNYQGDGAQISPTAIQGTPAVTPGGPADKAGLKAGDVITKLDGVPIDSGPTLVSEIWSHEPGQKVSVTYTRGGQTHTTTLTLGSRKGDQ